ncbi:DUF4190 domain-containing protein [Pseudobacteroides cellulosolvens]|uniref:DUF4190 domain-containing protein n=1 Tax=Pseudobacteroides cellulosolvens ATCC 35603 = DSM 2933 TaxID=398512 RepID=A0A0L6JXD6_9FIRM|nr:DUF4190 domain-containing protein [Pseudobacteroides cellulosolvens]KNY30409.1 protein of unknown function DUF4190 [Pseudobacteroides cellulosolvens ATCC 35603 = DSM 2933]
MKICPKCNYSNQDFDNVCVSCGTQLDNYSHYNSFAPPNMPVVTNGFSIASMILGISSIVLACCYGIGIIPGILGVIFGFMARKKIDNSQGREQGSGLALAGIITGFIGILFAIVVLIILALTFKDIDWNTYIQKMNELQRNNDRSF